MRFVNTTASVPRTLAALASTVSLQIRLCLTGFVEAKSCRNEVAGWKSGLELPGAASRLRRDLFAHVVIANRYTVLRHA